MNTVISTIIALTTIFLAAACSPTYYVPNTQNVPLISEKGETNISLTGNGNQIEAQGALGISNHAAIKLDGGLYIPKDLDNGNGGSGKFIEAGAGYFTPVGENFVFETYGIFGVGTVENHFPITDVANPATFGDISARIIRFGIQPNFGFKNDYFHIGLSSRFVNLFYGNIKGDLVYNNIDQIQYLEENSSHFMIEPALTFRGGFEKLKFQLQYCYSLNLSDSEFRQANSNLSLGLNFNF